ncbi:MAG: thymidine phosphorylase [Deltaproteobacteria bacterium]|nr:thymidine phosphorylase [Deltaproteobacteria bacterium]
MTQTPFSITSFLEAAREGRKLKREDIQYFIGHLAETGDGQVVAFLSHVFHKGLQRDNIVDLSLAMRDSGKALKWDGLAKPVVDKHSTGGVGDKVTISLGPLVASLGLAMPTISGRGLGFSGGTLDKLASIPGLRTALSMDEIQRLVARFGFCFGGQTDDIAPADRRLYALRDVTANVPSLPLITSSILAKKLAESLDVLLLDVKWGTGAFMQTLPQARELAKALVTTATGAGTKTKAMITNMNQPLGLLSGNWCEVVEAVEVLTKTKDECAHIADTRELVVSFAAELLLLSGACGDKHQAFEKVEDSLASGRPFERLCQLIDAQGGDSSVLEGDLDPFPQTKFQIEIRAERSGYIESMQTILLGEALVLAHAGRQKQTDEIAYNTSLSHHLKVGDAVKKGEILCTLRTDFNEHEGKIRELLTRAYNIGDRNVEAPRLIEEGVTIESL